MDYCVHLLINLDVTYYVLFRLRLYWQFAAVQ